MQLKPVRLLFASCDICRMEKMMCFMASGFTEILIIYFLDDRILMRFTVNRCFIFGIECFCSESFEIDMSSCISVTKRLSAAVHAAAGTCHDFDKVIVSLALSDLCEKFPCVCSSAYDSDFDICACYFVCKLMPAIFIIRESSRVVIEISISSSPSTLFCSRVRSNFFAVHGITETTQMFFGSMPIFSA